MSGMRWKLTTSGKLGVTHRFINATALNETNEEFGSAQPIGHPASYEAQITLSVFIGVLGVWSTMGNILTILAISMHRNMMTKCNYFILSLAISDLTSGALASPLWLYRRTWGFDEWMLGDFLCKLFWFVDESTSYCTAMHIASFAVWRYVGVKWPHSEKKLKKISVKIWICIVWLTAIVFGGAIFSTFYAVEDRTHNSSEEDFTRWPSCSIETENHGVKKHLIYYTFSSICFMLLPMVILFSFSMMIAGELMMYSNLKSSTRKAKEKRVVCQLALISASFLTGYVPMTIYVMWTTRTTHSDSRVDYWINVASYFCLRMSECLNPIIYNIASPGMRKASKQVIHYIRNCCRSDTEIDFILHNQALKRHPKSFKQTSSLDKKTRHSKEFRSECFSYPHCLTYSSKPKSNSKINLTVFHQPNNNSGARRSSI